MTKKHRPKVNESKDEVVDLLDMGNRNKTTVVRSKPDPELHNNHSSVECPEGKREGYHNDKPSDPQNPEPDYEEWLEADGAIIIDSTIYIRASNNRITKITDC
ncbi:MAG TPA: hypothetical protein VE504_06540 [Nitrososphaeraceae archaeon]|jgi:hypothetical protein|nr:hypothetical protein [Nitrososphaeraceae archaeon]